MKKKSILVSLVVAILAAMTFVGCSDSVVYPKTVTDAKITQIGDFLTGQNFDSNKFEVEVTYLDGSSSKTVGSVSLDSASAGIVSKDSYVTYTATDIKGNDIYRELSVSVYDIDKIEVTGGPESYSATVGEEPKIGQNTDYVVTASYYANGVAKTMPLSSNEYYVTFNAYDAGKAPEEAAEAVGATLKVQTYVGGSEDFYAPIQVTVTDKPVTPVVVEEITAVSWNGNFMPFNYAELPEIAFEDVNVSAKVEDETDPVTLTEDPGIEFSFVDATTHRPIRSLDLTQTANQDDLAIRAEYDGVVVFGNVTGYSDVEISVTYESDAKLVRGEAIPAINPADYIVTMVVDGNDPEELTLDASAFMYMSKSQEYKGTTVPEGTDPLGVRVNYNGIYSATYAFTAEELVSETPAIASVAFSVADTYDAPAKQYYNNDKYEAAIAITSGSIEDFEVTMTKGEPGAEQAIDKFTFALYAEEGVALSEAEPVTAGGEYDVLADLDSVLVGAYLTADADKEDKVIYYSDPVALATPEIETLTAVQDPATAGMVGDPVKVAIVASNTNGDVDKDYKGYSIDLDGKPFTGSFSALTFGEEEVTYTVWMTSDPTIVVKDGVKIPAGQGYYELSGKPVLVLKEDAPEFILVDANLIDSFDALYKIADDAFNTVGTVGEGKQTPAIKAYSVPSTREVVEGNNAITVTIEYYGKSGEVEKTTATVTIEGSSYVADGATFSFTYNGQPITALESGEPYNVANFKIVADAEHTHGTPEITITGIKDKWGGPVTGNFTADGNYAPYVVSFEYVDKTLETVPGAALNLPIASN